MEKCFIIKWVKNITWRYECRDYLIYVTTENIIIDSMKETRVQYNVAFFSKQSWMYSWLIWLCGWLHFMGLGLIPELKREVMQNTSIHRPLSADWLQCELLPHFTATMPSLLDGLCPQTVRSLLCVPLTLKLYWSDISVVVTRKVTNTYSLLTTL